MANIIEVQDLSDPALDVYARLTEPQLRNRREPEMGIFIAESLKVIRVALDAGCAPRSLLMTKRHLRGQGREIVDRCADVPVYMAEEAVLEELTGYPVNRGMLCAMARPAPVAPETVCAGARRVAVLEGIADATNVGAIFRSAAALGMDGVLLTPNCCTGGRCGSAWARCCNCRGPMWTDGPGRGWSGCGRLDLRRWHWRWRTKACPLTNPRWRGRSGWRWCWERKETASRPGP